MKVEIKLQEDEFIKLIDGVDDVEIPVEENSEELPAPQYQRGPKPAPLYNESVNGKWMW